MDRSHGTVKARSVPFLGRSSGCSIAGPPCGAVTSFWAALILPGEKRSPEDELDITSPLARCVSGHVCSQSPLLCLLGEAAAVGFKEAPKECVTNTRTEHEEELRR